MDLTPRRILKLTHQGAATGRGRSLMSTIALCNCSTQLNSTLGLCQTNNEMSSSKRAETGVRADVLH